ncbi:MAG: hypothetical protein AB7K64_02050 [Variibacter sp.]
MNDWQWIKHFRRRVVADHEKAARVLGISSADLSQHVNRGNIPCVDPNPGRGRSREFTFENILHGAIVLEMARYGIRFTEQNWDAASRITKWVFDTHSGEIATELIGKIVYFVVSFKSDGEMVPLKPQWSEQIKVGGIGHSALVIVITSILADLLTALKDEQPDDEQMEESLRALIQVRERR